MKNIKECFEGMQDITPYLKGETRLDEGLKDVWPFIKNKFKKAFTYLKNMVAKVGVYFVNLTDEGLVLPAISPLTMGSAYSEGYINKGNTFVHMSKEAAKITGCKTKLSDASKIYGSGNSIQYWSKLINENNQESIDTILEYFNNFEGDIDIINEVKLHTDDPEAKYNIIVDDAELKKYIKMVITNKKLARLLIWGAPGIGKTAILMNVLEEMGNENSNFKDYQLICKTLSNETPDNFTLPKYVSEVDDEDFELLAKSLKKEPSIIAKLLKKVGMDKATDVPKTWLPVYKPTGDAELDVVLDEKCGKGLLFVDELSRATSQVLNVILPLVNEGMFNGYKLGSGWTIICASNRAEDDGGQEKIGNALANRFLQIHYEPTVHTWRKWADKQGFISPLLLQWLSMPESEEMSGGKFYYMDPNEDSGHLSDTTLMCTPRAWTNAMRLLAAFSNTGSLEGFKIFDIPRNIIASTLNSCIPAQAVDAFLAFLAVIEKIGDFDQAVYEVWQNGGKGLKIDKKHLTKVALPLAQLICCAHGNTLPTKQEWENLCSWLVDQKSDQLASYVLDVFKNIYLAPIHGDDDMKFQMFWMQERIRRANGDMNKLTTFKTAFSDFCKKWNVDFMDIPDYSEGMQKLVKAYGASFETAVIDSHTSVLG